MSNPLCNLYVEAGSPLGEMDIDSVNQWAFDRINELEEKICELRHQYDYAVTQHFEEVERLARVNRERE